MGDITQVYSGSSRTQITISLAGLANGALRESTVIDNTTTKYLDCIVGGKITVGTTPTVDTLIRMWLYASWNSTDYTGACTGSDASYSAGQEGILIPLRPIKVPVATSDVTYEWIAGSVRRAFGEVPPKWGILVKNETGVSLNATSSNHDIGFWGIKKNVA